MVIGIEKARFYAYHGYYPEENVIGNWFEVDFLVAIPDVDLNDNLLQTLDYQKLYEFIKEVMATPVKLLETLIEKLFALLQNSKADFEWAEVTIRKQAPPGLIGVRNTLVKRKLVP